MTSVVARIVMRYLAAALVARGLLTEDIGAMLTGDADVIAAVTTVLGVVMAAAVEGWYYLARRLRWAT